jgi:hypothetical protein
MSTEPSQGGGTAGATSAGGGSTGATSSGGGTGTSAIIPTTTFKVTKPTMGDILQTDKDTYIAVVGGKPNPSWTAFESPMDTSKANAYQHHPTSTTASGKGQSRREKVRKQHLRKELPTYLPLSIQKKRDH